MRDITTDPALHETVKQRLGEALDLPPELLDPWLAELERKDPVVAERVRRLLDAHRNAGDFLDWPVEQTERSADAGSGVEHGQRIGPFTVERELGHGGMGTVLLGSRRDGGFIQHVAIKVIRGVDAHAAERLLEERRILATLNHASIAHFVDGGTTADGQPYLAMEYVEGVPLTAFCASQHLSQDARIRLFMRVCDAVHFAHQRLVVHRDIKPSNILVTADGLPKLLDFGIAKLLDPLRGPDTATVRILTPFYASPEQAAGDPVTTSTDVYSLGVLLYELLTGTGPYRTVSRDSPPLAVLDAIRQEPPERPGAAAARTGRTVDEDLDAILLKALRKDEADRYGSVEQLSQDLARYVEGQPVRAHDGSRAYLARKFVARHRGAVAAAAVAVISLTTAAVVSTWQARVARQERARADARFGDVRRLANAVVGPVYDAIAKVPGSTNAQGVLVKEALTYLDGLAAQAGDDVELKAELAEAYQKIGDVQGNPFGPHLGDVAGAAVSYARLIGLRESVAAARPGVPAATLALAAAEMRVGDIGVAQAKPDDAVRAYERALAVMARWANRPPDAAWSALESRIRNHLGRALSRAGKQPEAVVQLERSIELVGPLGTRPDAPDELIQSLIASHGALGDLMYYQERYADALTHFETTLTLARRLAAKTPDTATSRRNLHLTASRVGAALAELGRLDEAAVIRGEALAIQTQLAALDPTDAGLKQDLAVTHEQQAMLHLRRKDTAAAFKEITTSIRIFESAAAPNSAPRGYAPERGQAWGVLGSVEMASGREQAAIDAYRRGIAILSAASNDDPKRSDRLEMYEALGAALESQATKTGSADLRRQAREAFITARDGYKALDASGTLPESLKGKPAELDKKLAQ